MLIKDVLDQIQSMNDKFNNLHKNVDELKRKNTEKSINILKVSTLDSDFIIVFIVLCKQKVHQQSNVPIFGQKRLCVNVAKWYPFISAYIDMA